MSINRLLNIESVKSSINAIKICNNIEYFKELDSTNEFAKKLAEDGASEGTMVIADLQKAGKGRLDRKWFSPAGVNLYLSIILRPKINTNDANILTLISSISTVKALILYGLNPSIKWPNDVQVSGKKISGVLTEISSSNNLVNYVIVGIGININTTIKQLEEYENLSDTATSMLIESGTLIDRNKFLVNFINIFDSFYLEYCQQDKNIIIEKWMDRWNGFDRKARIDLGNETFHARCRGIDECGYLIVEKPDGELFTVYAGDVTLVDE